MALTDTWLKANHNKDRVKSVEIADRDGLSARISAKGKIVFQLRFRFNGKPQRVDLGTYPLLSLKSAREQTLHYRAELEKGKDPRIVKRIEKAKNIEALSLESLFNQWHDKYCSANKKHAAIIKRSFELYIFPKLGILPPDSISANQWMLLLESHKKERKFVAGDILINAKQMLSWGVRRNLIEKNVLANISVIKDLGIVSIPGKRSLNDDEIRWLFKALNESMMMYRNKLFIRLCLIYGCRNGELKFGLKSDIDFDAMTWTVPPERHKTGKSTGSPLIRPIIPETKELFEECFALDDSEYLMSANHNIATNLAKSVNDYLLRSHGYEMAHWCLHDLRKTARTNFSTLTQPHIAELMLGHKLPGEWQTYDKHDYLEEQSECLVKWVNKLKELEK